MNTKMGSNTPDNQSLNQHDDEPGLRELFGVLWAGKVKIVLITVCFAVGSVLYALSLPNYYLASTLLAPSKTGVSGLSGALGSIGGLASLAGVKIGNGASSDSQIAQRIMTSWSFVESFIVDNNLETELYYAKGWNQQTNQLEIDSHLFDDKTKTWSVNEDSSVSVVAPSSWELYETFLNFASVSEDQASGLVTVSFEYFSPQIAKLWTDMYVQAINGFMQQRRVDAVARNIDYLQHQITQTDIAEMQKVLYTIIEEQTKSKMLASATPEYTFVVVSPSMVSEKKSKPGRAAICIMWTVFGVFLSVFIVLLSHYFKQTNFSLVRQ
jgi:hypothetical protein